jgi:hypothetical protein
MSTSTQQNPVRDYLGVAAREHKSPFFHGALTFGSFRAFSILC